MCETEVTGEELLDTESCIFVLFYQKKNKNKNMRTGNMATGILFKRNVKSQAS